MVMKRNENLLNNFFDAYANRVNGALKGEEPDVDEAAQAFADYFVGTSPEGIAGGKNDEAFRQMIPKGYDFYKNIGITSMNIVSRDITPLDEFHAMVKVHWNAAFTRQDSSRGSITFDVIYFLRIMGAECKIFAYITGDEQKALKEYGLI